MLLQGQYVFNAPVERVWALLMDVSTLAKCLPGCRSLTPKGDGRYAMTISLNAPLVGGDYTGTLVIAETDAPRSYRLDVEGSGGSGGLRGSGRVTLIPEADTTRVDVRANAEASGFIAAFGPRLLETAAKGGLDRFYGCLQKQLG